METKTQISCPNCGTEVNVNEILYHKLEEDMKKKFSGEVAEHRKKYRDAVALLKNRENALSVQKENFNQQLKDSIEKQLKIERKQIR